MNTQPASDEIEKAIQKVVSWRPPLKVRLLRWWSGRRRTHHKTAKAFTAYAAGILGLDVGEPRLGTPGGRQWCGFGYGWRFKDAVLVLKPSMWGSATHVRAVIEPALSDRACVLEFYRADE